MNLIKELDIIKSTSCGAGFQTYNGESNWRKYPEDEYIEKYTLNNLTEIRKRLELLGNDKRAASAFLAATMKSRMATNKVSNTTDMNQIDASDLPEYRYTI